MTQGRLNRLAVALERFLNAKAELRERAVIAETNKVWMGIVIGFGLVMFLIWSMQALFIAVRGIAKAGGM